MISVYKQMISIVNSCHCRQIVAAVIDSSVPQDKTILKLLLNHRPCICILLGKITVIMPQFK